jgi:hypothetical protein
MLSSSVEQAQGFFNIYYYYYYYYCGGHTLVGERPGFGSHATVGKRLGESSVPEGRVRAVPRLRILPRNLF